MAESLYIAGPMSGFPRFNFDAFDRAALALAEAGYGIVSAADIDRSLGFDPGDPRWQNERAVQRFLRRVWPENVRQMCHHCDGLCLLPGWQWSQGAQAERAIAESIGLEIRELSGWIEIS